MGPKGQPREGERRYERSSPAVPTERSSLIDDIDAARGADDAPVWHRVHDASLRGNAVDDAVAERLAPIDPGHLDVAIRSAGGMLGVRILQPAVDDVSAIELALFDPGLASPGHRVPQGVAVLQVVPGADAADRGDHRHANQGESRPWDPRGAQAQRGHDHDE